MTIYTYTDLTGKDMWRHLNPMPPEVVDALKILKTVFNQDAKSQHIETLTPEVITNGVLGAAYEQDEETLSKVAGYALSKSDKPEIWQVVAGGLLGCFIGIIMKKVECQVSYNSSDSQVHRNLMASGIQATTEVLDFLARERPGNIALANGIKEAVQYYVSVAKVIGKVDVNQHFGFHLFLHAMGSYETLREYVKPALEDVLSHLAKSGDAMGIHKVMTPPGEFAEIYKAVGMVRPSGEVSSWGIEALKQKAMDMQQKPESESGLKL